MHIARALAVAAVALALTGHPTSAQDLSRYREYVLGSSLDAVITATRARTPDTKLLHERPARIQELEWRAPYVRSGSALADPVRQVVFTFCDDQLYQVVVTYDPERTAGLTDSDIVESLSATYGAPVLPPARAPMEAPAEAPPDSVVLARWEDTASSLTLLRGAYSPDFQLILRSKALSARARSAVREAIRLDGVEAPRRELERRRRDAADAMAAREQTRDTNKAAFKP